MTNTISKEYGKHAVIFLERLLFVTNEMLVSVNDKDLDKLENLITQRESLIDLAMAQKDTLIKTAQHARDKAGNLISMFEEKEYQLTNALMQWNDELFQQLQNSQHRKLATQYLQQERQTHEYP